LHPDPESRFTRPLLCCMLQHMHMGRLTLVHTCVCVCLCARPCMGQLPTLSLIHIHTCSGPGPPSPLCCPVPRSLPPCSLSSRLPSTGPLRRSIFTELEST
jgi:hypothetical protein